MRLAEIQLTDVFAGRNYVGTYNSEADMANPLVSEANEYKQGDVGVFSAVCKFADGSEHPALAVKILEPGRGQFQTFVFTRAGWVEIQAAGFFRAVGKYAHDVFPYDIFLANSWKEDAEVDDAEKHKRIFTDALPRLKMLKYEPLTTRRRMTP
jgi:hypothetical protein